MQKLSRGVAALDGREERKEGRTAKGHSQPQQCRQPTMAGFDKTVLKVKLKHVVGFDEGVRKGRKEALCNTTDNPKHDIRWTIALEQIIRVLVLVPVLVLVLVLVLTKRA